MMKTINLILLCITVVLFMVCNSDIGFIRIIQGRIGNTSWYNERILVRNIPRNNLKQSKVMINYFDSVGLSVNDLLEMPGINHYFMHFYKSTDATRRVFVENQHVSTYDGNRTYLGNLFVGYCRCDSTKWRVIIARNLGTSEDFDILGAVTKDEYLQNDCDPGWYEANKNNELVRYYMGLRSRRGAPR